MNIAAESNNILPTTGKQYTVTDLPGAIGLGLLTISIRHRAYYPADGMPG